MFGGCSGEEGVVVGMKITQCYDKSSCLPAHLLN